MLNHRGYSARGIEPKGGDLQVFRKTGRNGRINLSPELSRRSNLLAVLCAFDSVAEALKIVGRTVGELEEFRQQVLDAVELDPELAGLEVDVRGQGGDLVAGLGAQGDFHGGGLEVFANAFELGHQPPTPALLIAERLAVSHGFELLDQLLAVDEESSAGLVAAEAVQQLDGLPGV